LVLLAHTLPARAETARRGNVTVMFLFQEVGEAGIQAVDNTLTRVFEQRGYRVLDRDSVAQLLRRDANLLQLYEIEAAKRLGARLGADIVVSGKSQTRVTEKTYSSLEGKKVAVSQADVSAKAILVHTGRVLVAETAHENKAFDTTGNMALEKAAGKLAGKLLEGIERFVEDPSIDYRLILLNIDQRQASALQEALRNRLAGVQQVTEEAFINNTLELIVRVDKQADLAFKRALLTGLAELGLGSFTTVAREGETLYLRRTGAAAAPVPVPPHQKGAPPADSRPRPTERTKPEPPPPQPPVTSASPRPAGYQKSWAVVIGINDYQKWPKLHYAVRDAEDVVKHLHRLGFDEVIPLFDAAATRQNILRVLGDELYTKTMDNDRVLIFYAGHGQTQDLPGGGKEGYIIPVDGDEKDYYATAIKMGELQGLSNRLRAKHIFYVMDSCFSGLLLRPRGEGREHTTARARQVLTAGSEGEEVFEVGGHGLFTKVLLEGLQGSADLDKSGYITATELYTFIAPRVLQESRNAQNPAFGRIDPELGEFVFVLKQ
jgi:hypothetical protein